MSAANLSTMLFLNGLCLPYAVGTGLAEGETGQAEPDWPALADWLRNVPKVLFFAKDRDPDQEHFQDDLKGCHPVMSLCGISP